MTTEDIPVLHLTDAQCDAVIADEMPRTKPCRSLRELVRRGYALALADVVAIARPDPPVPGTKPGDPYVPR